MALGWVRRGHPGRAKMLYIYFPRGILEHHFQGIGELKFIDVFDLDHKIIRVGYAQYLN